MLVCRQRAAFVEPDVTTARHYSIPCHTFLASLVDCAEKSELTREQHISVNLDGSMPLHIAIGTAMIESRKRKRIGHAPSSATPLQDWP